MASATHIALAEAERKIARLTAELEDEEHAHSAALTKWTACKDERDALRSALETLLLNYGAALPEGQKDQRSIRKARAALGYADEQGTTEEKA